MVDTKERPGFKFDRTLTLSINGAVASTSLQLQRRQQPQRRRKTVGPSFLLCSFGTTLKTEISKDDTTP